MNWISANRRMPLIGTFIAAIRHPWPSFYWIGEYKGVPNEDEDMFDIWIELPHPGKKSSANCHVSGCRDITITRTYNDCGRVTVDSVFYRANSPR